MGEGEAQVDAGGGRCFDKKRVRTFDGMGAVKFSADGGELRPALQRVRAGPELHVVDYVRHGVAVTRIEDGSIRHHEETGPVVALEVTCGSRPESAERCAP